MFTRTSSMASMSMAEYLLTLVLQLLETVRMTSRTEIVYITDKSRLDATWDQ